MSSIAPETLFAAEYQSREFRFFDFQGVQLAFSASLPIPRSVEIFEEPSGNATKTPFTPLAKPDFESPSNRIKVHWTNGQSLSLGSSISADCTFEKQDGFEIVRQRDFIATYREGLFDREIVLLTDPDIEDGFFNFLRWFLPRKLLQKKTYVLHSSAVVTDNHRAILALGPSTAGKTTLAKLAAPRPVLGDDLNFVFEINGIPYVSPAPLGQQLQERSFFQQRFQVESFLWLNKSQTFSLTPLTRAESQRHLLSSLANLFWPSLPSPLVGQIFTDMLRLAQQADMRQLNFAIDDQVWPQIEESL